MPLYRVVGNIHTSTCQYIRCSRHGRNRTTSVLELDVLPLQQESQKRERHESHRTSLLNETREGASAAPMSSLRDQPPKQPINRPTNHHKTFTDQSTNPPTSQNFNQRRWLGLCRRTAGGIPYSYPLDAITDDTCLRTFFLWLWLCPSGCRFLWWDLWLLPWWVVAGIAVAACMCSGEP